MNNALTDMEKYNEYYINNTSGKSFKHIVALATYRAATDYAKAVRIINKRSPFAKVSKVLVRSLFESLVNLLYIDTRDDDLYVIEGLIKSLEKSAANLDNIESFLDDNNVKNIGRIHLSSLRSRQNNAGLNIDILKTERARLLDGKKSNYTSKMYLQARSIDYYNKTTHLDRTVFFNYQVLYPYWSGAVHLGVDGVSSWIKYRKKQLLINSDGESIRDVELIIWQTLAIYKDISVAVMRIFNKIDNEFVAKYEEIIEKNKPIS